MRILLAVSLAISGTRGCDHEYEIVPHFEPSLMFLLGCDEEPNAGALPDERPVAVCEAPAYEILPIHDQTALLGSASYDPSGHEIIDYHWRLVEQPTGSAVRLPPGGADRLGFAADVAGRYVAELVVTNDQCISSDPCQVVLDARPTQDLWVEMFWEHDGDDMDLHLVQGQAPLESELDCYFANCVGTGIPLGVEGAADDAFLDLDDVPGVGPENINIASPSPGSYRVVVHDYPGSTYTRSNRVTVRIMLDGVVAWEGSKDIGGEDTYTDFARIWWPEGTVEAL